MTLFFLELLSWLFIIIIPAFLSLSYLIIQRYFLLLSAVSILYFKEVLLSCFFLKLGLPPFHMWFFRIISFLGKTNFWFILTTHKILPIFIFISIATFMSAILLFLSIGLTSFFLLERTLFFNTLFFSSVIQTVWLFFRLFSRKSFSGLFMLRYMVLMWFFIESREKLKTFSLQLNCLNKLSWLLISGFPPFLMFWLKVNIVYWVLFSRAFFSIVMLITGVLSLSAYYRTWHLRLIKTRKGFSWNSRLILFSLIFFGLLYLVINGFRIQTWGFLCWHFFKIFSSCASL